MNVKDKQKIKKSDLLAEWDPFTIPVISQKGGFIIFKDLEDGVSTREVVDESTGIPSKMVIDWKQKSKNKSINPRIEIHDKQKNGNILTLDNGSLAVYELPAEAILGVSSNQKVKEGDFIARVPKESSKTKDITGGLARVAELFEARRPVLELNNDFEKLKERSKILQKTKKKKKNM